MRDEFGKNLREKKFIQICAGKHERIKPLGRQSSR
jgi:hypothetical protein